MINVTSAKLDLATSPLAILASANLALANSAVARVLGLGNLKGSWANQEEAYGGTTDAALWTLHIKRKSKNPMS